MRASTKHGPLENEVDLALGIAVPNHTQDLARPDRWINLGCNDTHIWGSFRGYTTLDVKIETPTLSLNSMAKACSCRNAKPCEHIAGLLHLFMETPALFDPTQVGSAQPGYLPSAASVAEDIRRGMVQLGRWQSDLIRQGLAQPQVQTLTFWEQISDAMAAARMPGIAQWLIEIGRIPSGTDDWAKPLLTELGRLYLAVRSFERLHDLPIEVRVDLMDVIGIRYSKVDIDLNNAVRDDWLVLGQKRRLRRDKTPEQWIWLYGKKSGRVALLQDVRPLEIRRGAALIVGQVVQALVGFLPSKSPLKAILLEQYASAPQFGIKGRTIAEAIAEYSQSAAANPWLSQYPVLLENVYMARYGGWVLRHDDGSYLPISERFAHKWVLYGLGGGHPLQVAAIWNGHELLTLSASNGEQWIDFSKVLPYV